MLFFEDDSLRIYNAPCEEILSGLPDASADLVITDPPYRINYHSNKPRKGKKNYKQIEGDSGEVPVSVLEQLYRVLKPDTACYMFTRWDVQSEWQAELEKAGFRVVNEIVWDKGGFGMGDLEGDWATVHETIIYCVKGNHKLNPPRPSTVISAQKNTPSSMIHPNEKPVSVWLRMIRASSKPGDLVLDPYAGSCSSMLACRQMSRRGLGCEIDPQWLLAAGSRLNQSLLLQTP